MENDQIFVSKNNRKLKNSFQEENLFSNIKEEYNDKFLLNQEINNFDNEIKTENQNSLNVEVDDLDYMKNVVLEENEININYDDEIKTK